METIDGLLNPFRHLVDYYKLRFDMGPLSNRFFLQLSNKAGCNTKRIELSKKVSMRKNEYETIVTELCKVAEVRGSGLQSAMTHQGLRASMI